MSATPFQHKVAFLPEPRMDVTSDAWLDWLVGLGYTGLYFEPDPGGPRRSGNISQFPTQYRCLSLYDLAWGERRHELRDWINDAGARAHQRGLKVYLALWEPRLPAEAWGLVPNSFHGRGGYDSPPFDHVSWCLAHRPAAAAFQQMAAEAFASVPVLDGLKIGTHDNDAHLCNPQRCERTAGMTKAQQVDRLFELLIGAVDQSGLHREDFDYVLYTWWWSQDETQAVAKHVAGRRVTVLGRSTQGLMQTFDGEEIGGVFDLALGIPGIGESFRKQVTAAAKRGWHVADMTGFGHTIEYFWLPYTPAPNRVAERIAGLREVGASGWFDYDCGGVYPGINTEIIREDHERPGEAPAATVSRALTRLYPVAERDAAAEAYRLAEEALALRPIGFHAPDVMMLSGRNTVEAAVLMPFDPGDFSGLDQGHRTAFGSPLNFMTPGAVPMLVAMYERAAKVWADGWAVFEPLEGQGEWAADVLPWEKKVYRCHLLCTRSAARYCRMAANRLARATGELTAAQERDALRDLLTAELADVEAFAPMWQRDHRLFQNAHIRLLEKIEDDVPWYRVDRDDPFGSKITHTRLMLDRIADDRRLDAVPVFGA